MHFTPRSNQMLRLRVVLIALIGVFVLAACEDITGPQKEVPLAPPTVMLSKSASDKMEDLGSSLDDMTTWSLLALPDGQGRANIMGKLNGLKGHLNTKKIAECRQDISDARKFLGALTEVEQVEVGHVGLALDVVQAALDSISQ